MCGGRNVARRLLCMDSHHFNRLELLFTEHRVKLYRLACRMTQDSDKARDLVQETFVRAATRAVPSGPQAEEAWLVRVLVNLCRDQWRRQRVRTRSQSTWDHRDVPDASATENSVLAHVLIWQALRLLAPRRRAVLILCELDELSVSDVGELLGISAVTVRWHLAKARREIAHIISGKYGSETIPNVTAARRSSTT